MHLRPYQNEAIEGARQAFRDGDDSVLIVAATGTGKTVVASAIIQNAEQLGTRTLFLAHRRELIKQTSEKLSLFGVRHGIIQRGFPMRLYERVQVASKDTLVNHLDAGFDFELIFIDEAHHASAESYQKVLRWFPKAKVVGLTATPWRLDGKGLSDVFDSHFVAITPKQGYEQGYLAPARYITYRPIDTKGVAVEKGDFNKGALTERALKPSVVGDVVTEYSRNCLGKRAVLFAVSIAHSQAMAQAFRGAGVACEHIDGEMHHEERDAILARFASGRTQVVTNVNVLTEGYDLPAIEAILLCRPTLSEALYLQMAGRGLRTSPGKLEVRIHDHARLSVFGHPYDERDFSPLRTAKKSRREMENTRVDVGGEMRPREVIHQREAIAEELKIDAKPRDTKPPPKPWFAKWSETERRQWFFRQVQANGVKKAKSYYRWASGEREWPPHEWVRLAQRVVVPATGAAP